MSEAIRLDLQPMVRIETAWAHPWVIAGCSQQGDRHFANGVPNADSYKIGGNQHAAWLIIGDGVGSRPLGYRGSRIATAAIEHRLHNVVREGPVTVAVMKDAFAAAHEAIQDTAKTEGLRPEDFATTLTAALLKGDTILTASLGDSSVTAYTMVEGDDGPEFSLIPFCSAPQPENKPKNYTYAITHPDWRSFTSFNSTDAPYVKALVLATDGAESFYLDGDYKDDERAFKPEIIAAFDTAVEKLSARGFYLFFSNFLHGYDPDNFDDRTLCIAYRAPEALAPPAPKSR